MHTFKENYSLKYIVVRNEKFGFLFFYLHFINIASIKRVFTLVTKQCRVGIFNHSW